MRGWKRGGWRLALAAALVLGGWALPAAGEAGPAEGGAASSGALRVEQAWVRAMPPVAKATAAYMVLVNEGDTPLRLVGGAAPMAAQVAPMITTHEAEGGGMAGMELVPFLEVPAHGRRVLEPGGDHLMLMKLDPVPQAGETVALTLHFQPGDLKVTLQAPVRSR